MITVPDVKNLHELSITEQHHMDESVHSRHDAARTEGRRCPASHWMLRPQRTPNPLIIHPNPNQRYPKPTLTRTHLMCHCERSAAISSPTLSLRGAQRRGNPDPCHTQNPVYPVHPVHPGKNPSLPPLPQWERVGVRVTASPCHCEERSRSWCACRTTWQSRSG